MSKVDFIVMAREIFDVTTDGRGRETFSGDSFSIDRFAALVAAIEREACAKDCEDDAFVEQWKGLAEAAIRIRSRGQE